MRLSTVALILLFPVASAATAGTSFDGQWKGEGGPTESCSGGTTLSFTLKNGEFEQFSFVGPRGETTEVSGKVKDDGTASIGWGPRRLHGELTFQGTSFKGKFDTPCGERELTGSRQG